jgi:hypothetical protein
MPRAIAISSMAWQTGAVSGPALAGILFAVMPSLPYALSSVLLAIATISIFRIRPVPPPPGNADTHPLRQIVEGMTYVGSDRFLLGCVTLDLFAVLLGGATALLPVYARDILTWHGQPVGSYGLGIMRAMPSLAQQPWASSWRGARSNAKSEPRCSSPSRPGIATAAFGLSRDFILSLGLLAALGAADMISVFIRNALVQLHVPDALRGRVSAISGLAISASNELGEMESGLAAALLGATGAVVFGGVGAVVVTVLWTIGFPELRRVRTFAVRYADE